MRSGRSGKSSRHNAWYVAYDEADVVLRNDRRKRVPIVVIEERCWTPEAGWQPSLESSDDAADLLIYFGSRRVLEFGTRYREMRAAYPQASIIGCSATRSIRGDILDEDVLVAVALRFARTAIRMTHQRVTELAHSRAAGAAIAEALAGTGLRAIFLLADGLRVDGSELIAGLYDAAEAGPLVFGGMASDPRDYHTVLVGGDCAPESGAVAAVGFYGDAIRFTNACASGWDAFGPTRRVTRSKGNVLYDLDAKPAYELYCRYLGDEFLTRAASDGVVFPLEISSPHQPERKLVRAPLAIDDDPLFMTFAGRVPEGWNARLMRGNADRLIFGAADAARQARAGDTRTGLCESLALIVSCAGRHQVMGQRTEEELEVAGAELTPSTKRIGFYSFGEIAPMASYGPSEVHNQSISITNVFELED